MEPSNWFAPLRGIAVLSTLLVVTPTAISSPAAPDADSASGRSRVGTTRVGSRRAVSSSSVRRSSGIGVYPVRYARSGPGETRSPASSAAPAA